MRRVVEPPAIGNLGDRLVRERRIDQVEPASLEPPPPQIVAERVARIFEQPLHVARRDSLLARDGRATEVGLAEMRLDDLADAVEDVHLGAGLAAQPILPAFASHAPRQYL